MRPHQAGFWAHKAEGLVKAQRPCPLRKEGRGTQVICSRQQVSSLDQGCLTLRSISYSCYLSVPHQSRSSFRTKALSSFTFDSPMPNTLPGTRYALWIVIDCILESENQVMWLWQQSTERWQAKLEQITARRGDVILHFPWMPEFYYQT